MIPPVTLCLEILEIIFVWIENKFYSNTTVLIRCFRKYAVLTSPEVQYPFSIKTRTGLENGGRWLMDAKTYIYSVEQHDDSLKVNDKWTRMAWCNPSLNTCKFISVHVWMDSFGIWLIVCNPNVKYPSSFRVWISDKPPSG